MAKLVSPVIELTGYTDRDIHILHEMIVSLKRELDYVLLNLDDENIIGISENKIK